MADTFGEVEGKVRVWHPAYEVGHEVGGNDSYVTEDYFVNHLESKGWKRRSDTAVKRLEKAEKEG
jgi:hypothetical protein